MVVSLLVSLAASLQGTSAALVPPAAARTLPPVTLWLSDSSLDPGARARAFVRLREPGSLVVLRVDGGGSIAIIFPASPGDDAWVPGGATYEVPGPDGRASFAVREPEGTGTVLAARRAMPFDFAALAQGDAWDYRALLFQPTAGDPLAALLDIVDRLANGRPFDYDVARYTVTPAAIAAAPSDGYLPAASPRYVSSGAPGAGMSPVPMSVVPGYAPPTAPLPTVTADCSSAYITGGSACASVVYNAAPEQAPSNAGYQQFYPYYNPYLYPRLYFFPPRIARDTVPVAPREQVLALPLRRAATLVPTVLPRQRTPSAVEPRPRGGEVVTSSMPQVLRSERTPQPDPSPAAAPAGATMVLPRALLRRSPARRP